MKATLPQRLWAKVEKTETCWLWTGYIKPSGHGQIQRGSRGEGNVNAHIAAYELLVGPLPDGYVLHHLCGVKRCVNPAHLECILRGEHPARHDDNISRSAPMREKGGVIGRCKRWQINRGRPCICGHHQEATT